MDNYFIFKSIDSRNVQGLIVQELPPITKPSKRIETIEIEGRDGDIIKSNGYKAYDKTIKMGLSRDYNLDIIENWLDGAGDLIMSNEPDKIYKAEILNSIDFKRLVTFKTADIKVHVQPFKYLLNEQKIILDINTETELVVINNRFTNK